MSRKLTQEQFIEKCKKVHGDKFDYTKTVYENCRTYITITCKIHNDISIKASNHLHMKQGCDACSRENHKLVELSNDQLENLKKIHNNKYIYDDKSINNGRINIICPHHGTFNQYLYFHEYGHGCSQCNSSSKGENKIKNFLEKRNINHQKNYSFDDCVKKRKLKFDFYLTDLNTIIEYDGEHHFQENKYFGEGNLSYIRENDEIKNKYCQERNIKLIRIPYYHFDKIDSILEKLLFSTKQLNYVVYNSYIKN